MTEPADAAPIGRAWMTIDSVFLARCIGLPDDVQIVRADSNGFDFGMRIGLQGKGLPVGHEGCVTQNINLMLRVEHEGNVERIFASYSHAPEKEWLSFERLVKPGVRFE